MGKDEIKESIKSKIIAVIRCDDYERARLISTTIIESGINVIEVTFTVSCAETLIKELKTMYHDSIIGAGTVLNIEQAKKAADNGSDFIVTPFVIEDVGAYCKEKDIFCSMAATTINEVFNSYRCGSDVVKLFPAEYMNPRIIKSIKAPLPFIDIMPTGGIDNNNIKSWFDNGAFTVGVGSYLYNGVNETNLQVLKERCKLLINAMA